MDERCIKCPLLCKRSAPEDLPVVYSYTQLSPPQIIALIETSINRFSGWHHLVVEQIQQSAGNQLAVLFKVGYMPDTTDNHIVLIAQATSIDGGQSGVYLQYGVPEEYCGHPAMRSFSTMITEVLENVAQSDWLFSRTRCH